MIKKIKRLWITEHKEILLFALILVVFSLLRIPSVIEPYWYGDEGIYEVIGRALRSGRVLYSEIWDNKPPVLYLIYAFFNGEQYYVRLASLIVGILTVIAFFAVATKIFRNQIAVFLSTAFFAVIFGSPLIEGNIANAENFILFPVLVSFYLLFVFSGKNKYINAAVAGLFVSIAFLTKIVAFFDFAAFLIIMFVIKNFDGFPSFKKISKTGVFKNFGQELVYAAVFLVPIFLTFFYFASKNALPDFMRATMFQNVGYVGWKNYFLLPMGFLYIKVALLALATIIVVKYREKLGKVGVAIFIWLFFALFSALFSSRPYTHYLLVLLPGFCLFLGYMLDNVRNLKLNLIIFAAVILIINQNFKTYTKIVPYYLNYLSFVTGFKSLPDYQNFFDGRTSKDYEIASFIKYKTEPEEGIFLWGDNAQIYVLSGKLPPGRYAVSYHITFYDNAISETKEALEKNYPRFIIQTKDTPEISNFLRGYTLRYKMEGATIYERQF
jgi:hypothetical protein